jgi:hypothetical protein
LSFLRTLESLLVARWPNGRLRHRLLSRRRQLISRRSYNGLVGCRWGAGQRRRLIRRHRRRDGAEGAAGREGGLRGGGGGGGGAGQ